MESMNGKRDIDPESDLREDDEEQALPELELEDAPAGTLAAGRAAITRFVKLAPAAPGVYRMIDAKGEVLYVGKAKSIKKRLASYARPTGYDARIARMISATVSLEFVTTATETEALLLEANLIKRLRPRFNVLLRDDKSFPYILITSDHWAPQILKHRGARTRPGRYYGPFASAGAVNRTINALQRAFLLRSCSDSFFEARTRPCLLYQIKRCSAPCTGEIDFAGYAELVREAHAFLSGRSRSVQKQLAKARWTRPPTRSISSTPRSIATASRRCRRSSRTRASIRAASRKPTCSPCTRPAATPASRCSSSAPGRTGATAPISPRPTARSAPARCWKPSSRSSTTTSRRRGSILVSHDFDERALLGAALSAKSERKVEVAAPQRGERKELVQHALANAREALARKLADTSSQQKLLGALTETFALPRPPRRIEVYDNSHIAGTNAVGAMIVAGPEGFRKNQYRKFNIRSEDLTPGDDYGMMREVLQRRFKRLLEENPRQARKFVNYLPPCGEGGAEGTGRGVDTIAGQEVTSLPIPLPQGGREEPAAGEQNIESDERDESPWPDLVLIDGGQGQLAAATETLAALGVNDLPLVAIAKGPDRDAGRETFFMRGQEPVQTAAARSAALFHRAAARRGASLRHRLAPRAPQEGHPRSGPAGNPRHRPHPQARAAAPFRHCESDRAREPARSRPGAGN